MDTDVNSTNCTPFPHYIDYPHRQSASIPIAQCITAHGFLNPNIPECFISDSKEAFKKGDIVVLGQGSGRKVVMEGIIEVGRCFILYEVQELGLIPMDCVRITQFVAPLKSHPSVLLHLLAYILMAFFPCFFQSSAIFGALDRASGRGEVQSQFSDLSSAV